PRHIGRTVEDILRCASAGSAAAAAATALTHGPGPTGTRRVVERFRLASEQKGDAALRIELHDHRRHLVDDPEVVLWIDADLRGEEKPVPPLADFAGELAVAIELEQTRSTVHERTRRGHRDRRMAG